MPHPSNEQPPPIPVDLPPVPEGSYRIRSVNLVECYCGPF